MRGNNNRLLTNTLNVLPRNVLHREILPRLNAKSAIRFSATSKKYQNAQRLPRAQFQSKIENIVQKVFAHIVLVMAKYRKAFWNSRESHHNHHRNAHLGGPVQLGSGFGIRINIYNQNVKFYLESPQGLLNFCLYNIVPDNKRGTLSYQLVFVRQGAHFDPVERMWGILFGYIVRAAVKAYNRNPVHLYAGPARPPTRRR